MENNFIDKLQEEINIADNRSKMQGDDAIEKARFEGKRDGLMMVRDELKKFIGFNPSVNGRKIKPLTNKELNRLSRLIGDTEDFYWKGIQQGGKQSNRIDKEIKWARAVLRRLA